MRRQQEARKTRLIDYGFTIVESDVLKTIPFNVPYVKNIVDDRRRLFRLAVQQGWGRNKYIQAIGQTYNARGWKNPGEKLNKAIIYHMVKQYEAEWRQNADPNDPYLLQQKRSHHGTKELLNKDKILAEKKRYRETHKEQIATYKRTHRQQINEARRKRDAFKRSMGL